MNIQTITRRLTDSLDSRGTRLDNFLHATVLLCIAKKRPGLSAYKTTAKIIENNQKIGMQTGPNEDGSTNMINQYTYNLVKNIYDALQNDCVVTTSIPTQNILAQVTGGNGGGPVTCVGSNITYTNTHGLTQ